MKPQLLLPLLLSLMFLLAAGQDYRKITHDEDAEARCLDGSPAAMYLHEGDSRNLLFFFQGGASCGGNSLEETLENCYQRSKTTLGSSLPWPARKNAEGILSTDPARNAYALWTKVIMIYCDGAFHQGYTRTPLAYKDALLHFRGSRVTQAHFRYIDQRYGLANAEQVILTGSSAGGIAAFVWADHLKALLTNPNTKFYNIPDSGIFLDQNQTLAGLQQLNNEMFTLLSVSNQDEGVPNSACGTAFGRQEEWNCLTIQGALPHLRTRSLFVQSAYDQYIIRYGANFTCISEGVSGFTLTRCGPKEMEVIQGYRTYYTRYIPQLLERGHSIWSISCSWHAVIPSDAFFNSPLQRVPMSSGRTMMQAVVAFVGGEQVRDVDIDGWPANVPCAY